MIIDGKKIAEKVVSEIAAKVKLLDGRPPHLKVILIGNHPASMAYIRRKNEAAKKAGFLSEVIHLDDQTTEEKLLEIIEQLNNDQTVDGILVQLPLPPSFSTKKIIHSILPQKDVDGFHPVNLGKLLAGENDGFVSCTPLGIQRLLTESEQDPSGKHVVIVGRSNIVGKPLAALLIQNLPWANATVTIAHSKTLNLKEICLQADILIVAIGRPKAITVDMVKPGAVVIDVGINSVDGKLVGDVDFEPIFEIASHITPVPGGVGPMTIASLLENTLKARLLRGK